MSSRRGASGSGVAPRLLLEKALLEAREHNSVCCAGVYAAAVLFAFLFGGLGIVVAGTTSRSLPWMAGMALGAGLGMSAARGQGDSVMPRATSAALASLPSAVASVPVAALEVGMTMLASVAASIFFMLGVPRVAQWDHACGCAIVGAAAWAGGTYGIDLLALACAPAQWRTAAHRLLQHLARFARDAFPLLAPYCAWFRLPCISDAAEAPAVMTISEAAIPAADAHASLHARAEVPV